MGLEHLKIISWDERRDLMTPGDAATTLEVCVRHFISCAQQAIQEKGAFYVALAGGSTPKAVYQKLSSDHFKEKVDWSKVFLFWGDERNVLPDSPESNYRMAMEAGLKTLPIPPSQIHRMEGEDPIEEHASAYDQILRQTLKDHPLDLVILGMGEDGHTASLFPQTEALKAEGRLAAANYVPQKSTWRITLTYEAINTARNIVIYVIGANKRETLHEVLNAEPQFDRYPIQKVGTKYNKALWIIDEDAAGDLIK